MWENINLGQEVEIDGKGDKEVWVSGYGHKNEAAKFSW